MDDLISRQAAVDAAYQYISQFDAIDANFLDGLKEAINIVKKLPSAQPEQCKFCKNRGLEDGDTLYISADWDGGIGFDFIRNIHYCPKCGRRL